MYGSQLLTENLKTSVSSQLPSVRGFKQQCI